MLLWYYFFRCRFVSSDTNAHLIVFFCVLLFKIEILHKKNAPYYIKNNNNHEQTNEPNQIISFSFFLLFCKTLSWCIFKCSLLSNVWVRLLRFFSIRSCSSIISCTQFKRQYQLFLCVASISLLFSFSLTYF